MKTRGLNLIGGLLALLAFGGQAEAAAEKCGAGDKQRVVMIGIQSQDEAVRGLLPILNDEYASALTGTGCYEVMTLGDISLSLQFDGLKAEFGCNDDNCRAKLDRELQRADLIAAGELRSTSVGHQLTLSLLDAVSRQSLTRYGPTPPTKSEIAHRGEIRKGVRVMAGLSPDIRVGGNLMAVLTLRDPGNRLRATETESLTTVVYVELAQSSLVTLVPRDRMAVLEAQLRDPTRVAQEARARYLLETELLTFSESLCGIAGTLYDLEQGTTRLATKVRGGCSQAALADGMETLASQILEILTPPTKAYWPVWLSAGAAVAAGTVGAVFFAGAVSDVRDRHAAPNIDAFRAADQAAREKATISNITFGIAGAAAATGLTYLLVQLFSGDDADAKTAWAGGDGGMMVRF